MERAILHQDGGNRTTALVKFGFHHDTIGFSVGIGSQLEDLGLHQDGFKQIFKIELLLGRYLDLKHFTTHAFNKHFMLKQFVAHAGRISCGQIDLVDRHDNGHPRLPGHG